MNNPPPPPRNDNNNNNNNGNNQNNNNNNNENEYFIPIPPPPPPPSTFPHPAYPPPPPPPPLPQPPVYQVPHNLHFNPNNHTLQHVSTTPTGFFSKIFHMFSGNSSSSPSPSSSSSSSSSSVPAVPPPPPPSIPLAPSTWDIDSSAVTLPDVQVRPALVGKIKHMNRFVDERIVEAKKTKWFSTEKIMGHVNYRSIVAMLPDLEVLILKNMDLKRVPEPILELTDLVELDLTGNPLIVLPDLSKFKKLQRLRFTGVYLKQLPKTITQLDSLIELTIEALYDWGWTFPPYKILAHFNDNPDHVRSIRELFLWMDKRTKKIDAKIENNSLTTKADPSVQSVFMWGSGLTSMPGQLTPTPFVLPSIQILQNSTVFQVACSGVHVVFLTDSGHVFTFGQGTMGQLGNGACRDTLNPQLVVDLEKSKIVQVGCGTTFTVALSEVGDVYTWGVVPSPKPEMRSRPVVEESLKRVRITKITCGVTHILALDNNSKVYSWGESSYGRLGREGDGNIAVIESLSNQSVVDIACGEQHSCCVTKAGAIWTWGRNMFGQCGSYPNDFLDAPRRLNSTEVFSKVKAGTKISLALTSDGRVFWWGVSKDTSLHLPLICSPPATIQKVKGAVEQTKIYDIACGSAHFMALSEVGGVYTWGQSWLGQTGLGTAFVDTPTLVNLPSSSPAFQICAGGHVSLAITGILRSELGKELGVAYNDPAYFTDLQIVISSPHNTLTETIHAHRCVLGVRSSVLRGKILSLAPDSKLEITTDQSPQLYHAFFKYLYTDQIDRGFISVEMKKLAEEYKVERLMKICSGTSVLIPKSTLSSDFGSLIGDSDFPGDLKVIVEGETVGTYKVFLCTRCKYFRAMFMGGMIESTQLSITLAEDVSHGAFMAVLQFIFSDKLPTSPVEEDVDENNNNNNNNNVDKEEEVDVNLALEAIPVANLFQMDRLKNMCESIVQKGISSDTVVYVWQTAKVYEAHQLRDFCLSVIGAELDEVVKSDYWNTISDEERKEIMAIAKQKRKI